MISLSDSAHHFHIFRPSIRKSTETKNKPKEKKKELYKQCIQSTVSPCGVLLPLVRVAGVAPFLRDVGYLHPGVVDAAGLPPSRQHLRLRPHPLAVVPAGHHQPQLQRPRRRLRRAPRRPVAPRHEPPVGRPDLPPQKNKPHHVTSRRCVRSNRCLLTTSPFKTRWETQQTNSQTGVKCPCLVVQYY